MSELRNVEVDVRGLPRPQGSMKSHVLPSGRVATRYPDGVWAWRHQVQYAVAALEEEPFTGPVELRLGFELLRPAGHFGTGRNAGLVRKGAPRWPAVMPDLDKLTRAVCDAITDAGLWRDDAQVVVIHTAKRYCDASPGVLIHVLEMPMEHPAVILDPDQLELFDTKEAARA
jgi:crossover junction endodeoxyribonuclease RusA